MSIQADLDIPFTSPSIGDDDIQAVTDSLRLGHLSGDGTFTRLASERLSGLVGGSPVLLTTSCTHALEMAAYLIDIAPGDEVIMPSFTFVSTANAFVARGATPVFVDIREDTLNLDESLVEAAITERTRAITVVHYGGVAAEMDTLQDITERHGLRLIEDNAHGLGAKYNGRPLGTIGHLAAQSFHATKNIVMGEGGALILNDDSLLKRAEVIREKGTNRSQFLRGTIDKYTWVDSGSSYLPSDLLSALLYSQLGRFEEIQSLRLRVWNRYHALLADWAEMAGVRLPTVPASAEHPAHLFYLVMPSADDQAGLISHLGQSGIGAASHYRPLHSSPFGAVVGRSLDNCPITNVVADSMVRLPLHADLTDEDVDRVVDATKAYRVRP